MFTESWRKQYPGHEEIAAESLPPNSSLALMVEMAGSAKRVLDVGCATGYLARALARRGCVVTGIDVNAEAADAAREVCDEVLVADLDVVPLSRVLGERRFDAIVMGDVLEHLRNPLPVLEAAGAHLLPGGHVVASIPNVAHGAVRLALLGGRFDYQELGLLDETHLRFFTRKTLEELFLFAGFAIVEVRTTTLELFEPSDLVPNVRRSDYPARIVEEIESDPDHRTLQFVVRASLLSGEARLRAMARRFTTANDELADANTRVRRLEADLESARREHHAAIERLERRAEEGRLHLEARERADAVIAASARQIERLQRRLDELDVERSASEHRTRMLTGEMAALRARVEDGKQSYAALEERSAAFAREVEMRARAESELLEGEIARVHEGIVWRARGALRRLLRRDERP